MGLDKSSERYTVDSDEGYFDAVVVLDFKKVNHPNIQLITSRGPPLEIILNFHSSERSNFLCH